MKINLLYTYLSLNLNSLSLGCVNFDSQSKNSAITLSTHAVSKRLQHKTSCIAYYFEFASTSTKYCSSSQWKEGNLNEQEWYILLLSNAAHSATRHTLAFMREHAVLQNAVLYLIWSSGQRHDLILMMHLTVKILYIHFKHLLQQHSFFSYCVFAHWGFRKNLSQNISRTFVCSYVFYVRHVTTCNLAGGKIRLIFD